MEDYNKHKFIDYDKLELECYGNNILESFIPLTKKPIDKRFVFERLDDISDYIFDYLLYDGIVVYIKSSDTYLMKTGDVLIPIISRFKFMNVEPIISELMVPVKDYATSKDTFMLKPLELDNIPSCYKYFTTAHYIYLNIEYNMINEDNNVNGNSLDIYNKYMRGTDCIVDLNNNIYISKECRKNDDGYNSRIFTRYVSFKFGRLFDVDNNIVKNIIKTIKCVKNTSTVIDNLYDVVSQMSSVISSIKMENFVSDQSEHISKINDSMISVKSSIDSLKNISNISLDYADTSYRNDTLPTPTKYINITKEFHNRYSKYSFEHQPTVGEDDHL